MNKQDNRQNRSMFLYTALIFAVALILIIIAFFGQTNISNLRRTAAITSVSETETAATQQPNENPTQEPQQDVLAQLANAAAVLETENSGLKDKLKIYEGLVKANSYISVNDYESAGKELNAIDSEKLTDDQKILYEQINNQIEEKSGKEQ